MIIQKRKLRIIVCIFVAMIIIVADSCKENRLESDPSFGFDKDGMLLIRGKRKFVIGAYHLPKTIKPFETLAKNGYNYVRVNNAEEMDTALKNNLYTWVYLNSIREDHRQEDKERIATLVNEYKTNPSLLFWEMEDEPAYTWNSAKPRILPAQMKETYDFIKKSDPEHLIITNHAPVNLISTLKKYNNSTDLVAVDVYPVVPYGIKPSYALFPDGLQGDLLNTYISQVGEYMDKMRLVVDHSKPVFAVLQGFAWELLKPEEERDTGMILFPSYEQLRFMAYDAIVHKANGILIWGTNYTPQPSSFMDGLNKVTTELAEMQDVLAAPAFELNINKTYHESGYSVDAGVEILVKKVNETSFILAVNSDKNPVKVSLHGLENYSGASVLKESRNLRINTGKLTDTFKPFDVHIYKLLNFN